MMYKIIFNMESPICFIDRPMFDGILIYCYMREKYGNIAVDFNFDNLNDFPIKNHKDGYSLASIMFFDKELSTQYMDSWKKRWDNQNDDLADFKGRVRKVSTSMEQFKSYNIPLNLFKINKVWFYFESDNIEYVERLINNQLAGIGKKVSQGYGFFKDFEIKEENHENKYCGAHFGFRH